MRKFLPPLLAEQIKVDPYFWNIDYSSIKDGGEVYATGWALPFDGLPLNFTVTANGRPPVSLDRKESINVVKEFAWWPNALMSGFTATFQIDNLNPETELVFEARPIGGAAPNQGTDFSRKLFIVQNFPATTPPEELRRTIGLPDPHRYRMAGRTIFRGFENVLVRYMNRPVGELDHIVDWGCGPGRVACHFLQEGIRSKRFTGLDIVKESVDWAASQYSGKFVTCDIKPPIPLQTMSVDAIYSYSVFTHIPRDLIPFWVDELARVLKGGGYVLTTILGELAFAKFRTFSNEASISAWIASGISDATANKDLAETGLPNDYYRNVFLTKTQVGNIFGAQFEICEIIENFHFYQDLVILRKK